MDLIERYITEVGKHLPSKNRSDIQTEIKSTLEDMLEDRSSTSHHPVDDEMIKEVLKTYGAPDKVAASYLPERYLIGPRLFPIFTLVLKIVLSVLTVMAVVGFGIRFGTGPQTAEAFISTFGKSLAEYITGILSAFGNIVLVFAILQWTLPDTEFEDKKEKKAWDPAELEKEPEPGVISLWEPIFTILMTVLGLLAFNLYPQYLGIVFLQGDKWTFIPALTEAFFRYLPFINIICVLQIILNLILLRQGRWTTLTRSFEIALSLLSIVLAYLLLTGPALVSLSAADLAKVIPDAEAVNILARMFSVMPSFILIIIICLEGLDLLKKLYRLLLKPRNNLPVMTK